MSLFFPCSYRVLSLMAGSSADGVTAALLRYERRPSGWVYAVLEGRIFEYPSEWSQILLQSPTLSARHLLELSIAYTDWTAEIIFRNFRERVYELIAWHPHTVFHVPAIGLTWSLGDSERLRVKVGCPVVTHFRARDIACGGTGAPLIPNADALLLSEYETLLNLGGIANLTHLPTGIGYDIAPCNQLLNALAAQADPRLSYDPEGTLARQGHFLPSLAEQIREHPFFRQSAPKALDNERVQKEFIQPFLQYPAPPIDKLHTATQLIVELLLQALSEVGAQRFSCTGGGVYNRFLMELLISKAAEQNILYMPSPPELVDYRESIGFGLLGLLRWLGETNTYGGWTGARGAQSSGLLSL
ncbi:MAG: anhydro-N-acetylmuramic acid kinase [Bacteroidia bacterium]|nr:anhydro-N-acetylmuramic acid kinase [Bacteroidia bacterium]MDW8015697.1 anhydro-N-acetylmuramic acid kinase [Bacteroidia bacterium]